MAFRFNLGGRALAGVGCWTLILITLAEMTTVWFAVIAATDDFARNTSLRFEMYKTSHADDRVQNRSAIAVGYASYDTAATLDDAIRRLNQCREAAKENGHFIPERFEFVDDLSDGTERRPGWKRLLRILRAKQISNLYFHDRNASAALALLRRGATLRILRQHGVSFFYVFGECVPIDLSV